MAGNGIMVFAEISDDGTPAAATQELLGLGSRLAGVAGCPLQAALVCREAEAAAPALFRLGADAVYAVEGEPYGSYDPGMQAAALEGIVRQAEPAAVLFGHTPVGQDLAPRLSFALGAGLVTDAVKVEMEGGRLLCTKPVYGGNAMAVYGWQGRPAVATVRAGVGEAPAPDSARQGQLFKVEAEAAPSRARMVERVHEEGEEVRLEEARLVVSGGRGMGGPEGFEQLGELARLLKGAVGASRPPVDAGWLPSTAQVGITGRIVSPEVYIAVAISGSSQHLSGMGDSRVIVAVNKDPEAYIFKVSDFGVVGEWQQVLPAFIARVRDMVGVG